MGSLFLYVFTGGLVLADTSAVAKSQPDFDSQNPVSTLYLGDKSVAVVPISMRGTVLSFPTKPMKVILGSSGAFGVEYVERDIAVTPLRTNARANLFVYMLGRRFTFDLVASETSGRAVVVIKDQIEDLAPSKDAAAQGELQPKNAPSSQVIIDSKLRSPEPQTAVRPGGKNGAK